MITLALRSFFLLPPSPVFTIRLLFAYAIENYKHKNVQIVSLGNVIPSYVDRNDSLRSLMQSEIYSMVYIIHKSLFNNCHNRFSCPFKSYSIYNVSVFSFFLSRAVIYVALCCFRLPKSFNRIVSVEYL